MRDVLQEWLVKDFRGLWRRNVGERGDNGALLLIAMGMSSGFEAGRTLYGTEDERQAGDICSARTCSLRYTNATIWPSKNESQGYRRESPRLSSREIRGHSGPNVVASGYMLHFEQYAHKNLYRISHISVSQQITNMACA
jgi:hypothetical protein